MKKLRIRRKEEENCIEVLSKKFEELSLSTEKLAVSIKNMKKRLARLQSW
jgi:hypothetical protein